MSNLVLPVTGFWFNEFLAGRKDEELRLDTPYWRKRLVGRTYDLVIITLGYPKHGQTDRIQVFKWNGYEERDMTHVHFGPDQVHLFAIDCTERI